MTEQINDMYATCRRYKSNQQDISKLQSINRILRVRIIKEYKRNPFMGARRVANMMGVSRQSFYQYLKEYDTNPKEYDIPF